MNRDDEKSMNYVLVIFSMGELPHVFMIPETSELYTIAIKSNRLTINVNDHNYPPEACQLLCELSDFVYCVENNVSPEGFDFRKEIPGLHLKDLAELKFYVETKLTIVRCEFAL